MIQLCNQTGSYNLLLWLHLLKGMGVSSEGVPQEGTVFLHPLTAFSASLHGTAVSSVCEPYTAYMYLGHSTARIPTPASKVTSYCHQCAHSCFIAAGTPVSPGELVIILPFCFSDYCPGLAQSCRILSELQSCYQCGTQLSLASGQCSFFLFLLLHEPFPSCFSI